MYGGFFSSINFWLDLVNISDVMKNADPKIVVLRTELKKMNEKLPAAVYVPFYSSTMRNYALLNIVTNESKVFSTKQRTPFYICIEIFRPEEDSQNEMTT